MIASPAVDPKTLEYYEREAAALAARYEAMAGGVARYFPQAFPEGGRILDLGAGTGRDLAVLHEAGHEVYGIEPAAAMRKVSLERHPELAGRLVAGALPTELPSPDDLGGRFDGVLCSAVLQHVPRAMLFESVFAIKGLLADGGRALVSVPAARPGLDAGHRDDGGRLFTPVTAGELQLLFERAGFVTRDRFEDADALGRAGHTWTTFVFALDGAGDTRPLDRIQAVLSQDKKVATYKLALVRALCDVALTQPHRVRWREDGKVAVPFTAVAERWIGYYWRLFEGEGFLPQTAGAWTAQAHRVGFAAQLAALMGHYRHRGGLSAYVLDYRAGGLNGGAATASRALLTKTRQVIRAGPVTYAKGGTEGLFGHARGDILVDGALWRELSLMGHWIQDAVVVRWAEETRRLSAENVPVAEVVDRLLRPAVDHRRITDPARQVYEALPDLRCVWTGRPLRRFDVDHAIPFALWRNNDLWNLLPADPKVNNRKRDRLPDRLLLRRRRDTIHRYWDATRAASPARFEAESRALTGVADAGLDALFLVLLESVAVTAQQRGVPTWAP